MSRKSNHIIIEIDGSEASIAAVSIAKRAVVVEHYWKGAIEDSESLRKQVHEISNKVGADGVVNANVILPDRSFGSAEISLPKLSRGDLARVLRREASGALNKTDSSSMLVGHLERGSDRRAVRRYSVLAVSTENLDVLDACIQDPLIRIRHLVRRNDAYISTLPDSLSNRSLMLIGQDGGIRFDYLENGCIREGRQVNVRVPGEDADEKESEKFQGRLSLEIQRTLDHLAQLNLNDPERVVIPPSFQVDDKQLAGMLPVDRAFPEGELLECSGEALSASMQGLIRHLTGKKALLTIEMNRVEPSFSRAGLIPTVIGGLLVMSLAGVVTTGRQWRRVSEEETNVRNQIEDLEQMRMQQAMLQATGEEHSRVDPVLQGLLYSRRPASRLLTFISNTCPEGIQLDEVRYSAEDQITILGRVGVSTRLRAIELLDGFKRELSGSELLDQVKEDVRYKPDMRTTTLVFEMKARWAQ